MLDAFFAFFIDALEGYKGWALEIASVLFVVFLINVVLKWILQRLHVRFQAKGSIWKDTLVVAMITPLTSLVWLVAGVQVLNFLFEKVTKTTIITSPHAVFKIGLILALSWFLMRWKKGIVKKVHEQAKRKDHRLDKGKIDVLDKLGTLTIILMAALLLLEQTGGNMNTLIAFGGVSGLAIAFASQQIISNFFGGMIIYFTQPFVVGDTIRLPEKGIEGDVEEIGWYTTLIRAFDKTPVYVPNSLLTNVLVVNPSRISFRQFKQVIALRYQDLPQVPEIIEDLETLLHEHLDITDHHSHHVHLTAFGDKAIEITISAYSTIVDKYSFADLTQDLLLKISSIVFKHGADFAIPVMGVEFPKGMPSQ